MANKQIAIVTTDISKFIFGSVAEHSWQIQDYTTSANSPTKLFNLLLNKPAPAYLIDLDALTGDAEDIAQNLIHLRDVTGVPVVLFASGYKMDHPLVEYLRMNSFEQWVTSDEITTMRTQLTECLDGAENAILLAEQERQEIKELKSNVAPGHRTIGFVGSCKGAGTTTQALQFAFYLQKQGYKTCYIEMGNQHHIEKLSSQKEVELLDNELGYLQYKGLDIYYKPLMVTPNMRLAYDVCIYDFAVINTQNLSSFLGCTARVCLAGSKAWEYGLLRWALNLLTKEKILYLIPFATKAQRAGLLEKMGNKAKKVMFPVLWPDPFCSVPKNRPIYKVLFQVLCIDNKKTLRRSDNEKRKQHSVASA